MKTLEDIRRDKDLQSQIHSKTNGITIRGVESTREGDMAYPATKVKCVDSKRVWGEGQESSHSEDKIKDPPQCGRFHSWLTV